MKKINFSLFLFISLLAFTACSDDDESDNRSSEYNALVANYGNYGGTLGTITGISTDNDTAITDVYEGVNNIPMNGNIQYMTKVGDRIYILSNDKDEVLYIDAYDFTQTKDGLDSEDGIVKPRYCVANGNNLYVSCWGGNMWEDESFSYIAIIDMENNEVTDKIMIPSGPEGLAVVDNNLYIALQYDTKIAVMNLDTKEVSYIEDQEAVGSYFAYDGENLYLAQTSTYSDPSNNTGIRLINTDDQTTGDIFEIPNFSGTYASMISYNADKSRLYIRTHDGSYGEDGNPTGTGVIYIDPSTGTSHSFVNSEDGTAIQSVTVDTSTDEVYITRQSAATDIGTLEIYNSNAELLHTYTTGVSPVWTLFTE